MSLPNDQQHAEFVSTEATEMSESYCL